MMNGGSREGLPHPFIFRLIIHSDTLFFKKSLTTVDFGAFKTVLKL